MISDSKPRSLSNKVQKERPPSIKRDNFLCQTERSSIANQLNLLHQLSQSRAISHLLKEPTKPVLTLSGKNLQLKSSISKKLLKAFKEKSSPARATDHRKSMQFIEMPRKFSSERTINRSGIGGTKETRDKR